MTLHGTMQIYSIENSRYSLAASLATHAILEYDHVANIYGGRLLNVNIPENATI